MKSGGRLQYTTLSSLVDISFLTMSHGGGGEGDFGILADSTSKYSGSVTFLYGSGSTDPCHSSTEPDPR
jgi:hypothetical protein